MGRESGRKRSLHTVGNSLTGMSVGSFGVSEGNITTHVLPSELSTLMTPRICSTVHTKNKNTTKGDITPNPEMIHCTIVYGDHIFVHLHCAVSSSLIM